MRTEAGHVLAVNAERLGDNLDADALIAATTLVVGDVADFDELGGSLLVGGVVLRYSTCNDELGTVTLTDPLPAAAEIGDPVYVWDTHRQAVATEHVAQVVVDSDDEGDPIEAVVASHLVYRLPTGIRALVGESVLMEDEDDEWRVVDVLGLEDQSPVKFRNLDKFTLTVAGAQDLDLTFMPIDGSEHVYWNGLQQTRTTSWTRTEKKVSILGAEALAGDVIDVEYAYLDGSASPIRPADAPTLVEFDQVSAGGFNAVTDITPQPGDIVIVVMSDYTAPPREVTACTGMGATWTKVYDGPSTDSEHTVWVGTGPTTAGTISCTLSGASFDCYMNVFVLRGFGTPSVTVSETEGTGTSLTGPTLVAGLGSFVIAAGASRAGTGLTFPSAKTPTTGWTIPATVAAVNTSHGVAHRIPATSETHRADVGSSTSVDVWALLIVVEEAP